MATPNYFVVPAQLWAHKDLTVMERVILASIDNLSDGNCRYDKPTGRIATILSIPKHIVNETIASLHKKGAVSITMKDNGDAVIVPHVEKRHYTSSESDDVALPADSDAIDYDDVLAQWKSSCPDLPTPRMFTEKMKRQLRSLLKNNKSNIDELYKVFKAVGCSDFLQGKVGRGDWKASLHWILKDSNSSYSRIIDGSFHHSDRERTALDEIFTPDGNHTIETYYR